MIIAALITFGALALAWAFAPGERPAEPATPAALPREPLAEAA